MSFTLVRSDYNPRCFLKLPVQPLRHVTCVFDRCDDVFETLLLLSIKILMKTLRTVLEETQFLFVQKELETNN